MFTLRSVSEPSEELLDVAEKLFSSRSSRSAVQDPLAAKGSQVLQLLKEKSETVARELSSPSWTLWKS